MKKLIFVYNANSGFINSLSEYYTKKINPDGYDCNLCKITFPGWSMDKDWKKFIDSLKIKSEFLHKDEFYKKYPDKSKFRDFPCAFIDDGKELKLRVTSKEINKCDSISELKELMKKNI